MLIGIDQDQEALRATGQRLAEFGDAARLVHGNFGELEQHLDDLGVSALDGFILDIGVSSHQLDSVNRGFSFQHDAPLDMRMDTTRGESVAQWLATAEVNQITEVIREYGEERFAGPIAKAIVARRQERGPLSTTSELAQLAGG